jgi:DNA modification methylase
MKDYQEFLNSKKKQHIKSGFDIDQGELNRNLFPFQKYIVQKSLSAGRYAIFADTGLGKTLMQLSWAYEVVKKTNQPVIILAPLAVVNQTINEGGKFGIKVWQWDNTPQLRQNAEEHFYNRIYITNYEQLGNISDENLSCFSGVVLDESSILKSFDGKTKRMILDRFVNTPYKLACSATPSPNDHMELGNHSEFLGAMSYHEVLAMFFVHDGGETSKWRLRKHAEQDFWDFVLSWSIAIDNPSTFGFDSTGYDLPKLNYIEHYVEVESENNNLFGEAIVSATDLHKELRLSINDRVQKAADIVSENPNEQWLIWGLQNKETDLLSKAIPNSINVQGSDKPEIKAQRLTGFANGDFQNLITKTKIASFGMNYQNSCNMVFVSYDFGFESFYQAVRRSYRFGQTKEVNVHIIIPKNQINVRKTIQSKTKKHQEMIHNLAVKSYNYQKQTKKTMKQEEVKTDDYWLMNGDCVEMAKNIPDNKVDLAIFSPPFSELYVYSDKEQDMGNSKDYNEFEKHFKYLIPEIKRTLKPGRICAVHCMDLPIQKGKEGFIGLRDFSGMLQQWFVDEGFIYHARVTVWKNPVTEMQRTKALGLLHKTIKKDSVMSRVGIPDYVLFFRNEGQNETPITHQDKDPAKPDYLPVDLWQKYASPVWYDVDYSRTLQYTTARDNNDEKHICPLQLDTIERCIHLYSNEGETVASYFGGIGSEGYQALKMGRKSISIELKESYFKVNADNHKRAILQQAQKTLF